MVDPINRIQFLRGDLRGGNLPVRPPWSVAETLFVDGCSRCDNCISRCEQQILQRGAGGFPQVDFSRGHCTFCGECVKACGEGVLFFHLDANTPPWSLVVEFADRCLSKQAIVCRSCGERCDESAIRFQLQPGGRANPMLIDDLCNGCGECVGICPTKAIHIRPLRQDQAA